MQEQPHLSFLPLQNYCSDNLSNQVLVLLPFIIIFLPSGKIGSGTMSGEPPPVDANPELLSLEAHDPPEGQVLPEQKTVPIFERPPEYHDSSAWCYLR